VPVKGDTHQFHYGDRLSASYIKNVFPTPIPCGKHSEGMYLIGSCRMDSFYLLKICLVALDSSYLIGAVPVDGLDVWLTLLLPLLLAL
jgi:hypothetical protein